MRPADVQPDASPSPHRQLTLTTAMVIVSETSGPPNGVGDKSPGGRAVKYVGRSARVAAAGRVVIRRSGGVTLRRYRATSAMAVSPTGTTWSGPPMQTVPSMRSRKADVVRYTRYSSRCGGQAGEVRAATQSREPVVPLGEFVG